MFQIALSFIQQSLLRSILVYLVYLVYFVHFVDLVYLVYFVRKVYIVTSLYLTDQRPLLESLPLRITCDRHNYVISNCNAFFNEMQN